ncbi:MAG TPA: transposase [Gaiellaceae bacterium]|nr:transposase [Gaiellaceae bacterium]
MGREARAIDPEHAYHVTCRGSRRYPIVFDDADCHAFVDELHRIAARFEWEVLAWCLMPNHHHLVLRTEQPSFSAGFQQLNGNHARRTNRRHGWDAHLFKNRPRAGRCDSTAHVIGAVAYVVRNPVAAGLVRHARAWPWSSYRATVGEAPAPSWLRVDEVLELFGTTHERACRAFDDLVHNGHLLVSDTEELPADLQPSL